MTGAGSVITRDVPRGALGIERAEQRNLEGFRDRKDRKAAAAAKRTRGSRATPGEGKP